MAAPLALACVLTLSGCASFSPDDGMDKVSTLSRERTGHGVVAQRSQADADAAAARSAEILKAPLTADTAVELALLNNAGLQASLAELGIAEAELVQAGRLRNPVFGFGRLAGGGALEIDRSLMFDLLGLLSMPAATKVQQQHFEQVQLEAAQATVNLATQARLAYFNALAAQELVSYFEQVHDAADAAAELARRMQKAGNFSALEQLREQSFQADALAELSRSRQAATAERERLTRVLGLASFTLPEHLPELPAEPMAPQAAEQTAIDRRLDVLAAKRRAEASAAALGLTRATRFVNVLELGYQNRSERGATSLAQGYEVSLELPLFDFGMARSVRAEAVYQQALHRTAETALNAQSEVREAHAGYLSAYTLARHYRNEVLPLKQRIADETLLRYNGMLVGVFELLTDAREQIRSVAASVQAQRDFWIADTQLQAALGGR